MKKEVAEEVVAMSPAGLMCKKMTHEQALIREARNLATKVVNQHMEVWIESKSTTENALKAYLELQRRNLDPESVIFIPVNRMAGASQVAHINDLAWRAVRSVIEDYRQKGWDVEAFDPHQNDTPIGYLFFIPTEEL